MTVAEDKELEWAETKTPHLRVLQGGKGPPDPPSTNWLSSLPVRTQFACRLNDKTIDWEMCFLVYTMPEIYILKVEAVDGSVFERRVDPVLFSNLYKDYRVIQLNPPLKIEQEASEDAVEAPTGDENERPNYD